MKGVETEELYFVHRSIYEYFVADMIYNSVEKAISELSEESQEEFATNIVFFLKRGRISKTIGEYLKYKILIGFYKLPDVKKNYFIRWWETTIKLMLDKGLFYFCKERWENMLVKELVCFRNLMHIMTLLLQIYPKNRYIMEEIDTVYLEFYIKLIGTGWKEPIDEYLIFCNREMNLERFNLEKSDFSNIMYKGINLKESNLKESNLKNVVLKNANLYGVNLKKADLYKADLQKANLRRANLKDANLYRADLREANLESAVLYRVDLRRAYLDGKRQIRTCSEIYGVLL